MAIPIISWKDSYELEEALELLENGDAPYWLASICRTEAHRQKQIQDIRAELHDRGEA